MERKRNLWNLFPSSLCYRRPQVLWLLCSPERCVQKSHLQLLLIRREAFALEDGFLQFLVSKGTIQLSLSISIPIFLFSLWNSRKCNQSISHGGYRENSKKNLSFLLRKPFSPLDEGLISIKFSLIFTIFWTCRRRRTRASITGSLWWWIAANTFSGTNYKTVLSSLRNSKDLPFSFLFYLFFIWELGFHFCCFTGRRDDYNQNNCPPLRKWEIEYYRCLARLEFTITTELSAFFA